MAIKSVLKAQTQAELLSYIINTTPELRDNIDLPVQGQSIAPIGQLIINNERYRNAFINTVNLIGLTVIKRNAWDNPWDFTRRGTLRFGQQIREMILDLVNVYDYNEHFDDKKKFLETEVPNVLNFIHEINFQKFYKTTTNEMQLAMAFEGEDSLFDFIETSISMLFESLKYDTYITDKYMLCRRILDGTMTSIEINNFSTITPRERVSALKNISNKFTFRSPNYNPAGIRRATRFDDQILIVNTLFEAQFSTEVLATSFFKDEADMRARLVLIDGFDNHDIPRLTELLGDAFIPFTDEEIEDLATVPAVLISREWFMDYDYALDTSSGVKQTEFFNPQTFENNHFLHAWRVFSTSPFENCAVFTSDKATVISVEVSPAVATVSAGQSLQLSSIVETLGFANKAVLWSIDVADATINQSGLLKTTTETATGTITVTATSIFDKTINGTATITVV